VPIVFLTAYSDEQTLAEAKGPMAYGFVVKPYRETQVHAAIQMALARHDAELNGGT
jgi:AmiR/NasT family two-component response regulator